MNDPRSGIRAIALLGIVLLGIALGAAAYQATLNLSLQRGCNSVTTDSNDDPIFQACMSRQLLSMVLGDLAPALFIGALLSGIALLVVLARLRSRQDAAGPAIR
jgi:hypothetical protein